MKSNKMDLEHITLKLVLTGITGLFLLTGCGQNRIVLEKIDHADISSSTTDTAQDAAGTGTIRDRLDKDHCGRWILGRNIVRDIVFTRALENRIQANRQQTMDKCFLDILSDLSILVQNLGTKAVLSRDAMDFFAREVRGAEFLPWLYIKAFTIQPARHGADIHLVFDKELIRRKGITIEGNLFKHKAIVKENNGSSQKRSFG